MNRNIKVEDGCTVIINGVSFTDTFFYLSHTVLVPLTPYHENMDKALIVKMAGEQLSAISEKILDGTRIDRHEGLTLYEKASLPFLGILASSVRTRKNGLITYFNHNFHIEPTNLCIYNCRFCSYHKRKGDSKSWDYSIEQMMETVGRYNGEPVTEVHIVGGVHPDYDLHHWGLLLSRIRAHRPSLHIKAFSAVELDYMIRKAGMSYHEGLMTLKEYGLDSIPGGGAEIFDEEVRNKICPEKTSSADWLEIHETAHRLGIPSNATMLYGHIETPQQRIDHMDRLRDLQDRTGGFNSFIPLKFKRANNMMSYLEEATLTEDLRTYALARIFLDNITHVKAYWPMLGKEATALSLSFGVDDIDGTIDDTTRIYSMAGSEQKPVMSREEMAAMIRNAGFRPVERDTLYNIIREY